jgi:nitrogen regulatory protein PII
MSHVIAMSLVTIVTENLLKEQITALLRENQVTGFTISRVDGEGSRGIRAKDWEGPNLKIEAVCSPHIAEEVLTSISEKFFDNYAVIAWLSEVNVLRGEKFMRKREN